jgi:hypothetical protein
MESNYDSQAAFPRRGRSGSLDLGSGDDDYYSRPDEKTTNSFNSRPRAPPLLSVPPLESGGSSINGDELPSDVDDARPWGATNRKAQDTSKTPLNERVLPLSSDHKQPYKEASVQEPIIQDPFIRDQYSESRNGDMTAKDNHVTVTSARDSMS